MSREHDQIRRMRFQEIQYRFYRVILLDHDLDGVDTQLGYG